MKSTPSEKKIFHSFFLFTKVIYCTTIIDTPQQVTKGFNHNLIQTGLTSQVTFYWIKLILISTVTID